MTTELVERAKRAVAKRRHRHRTRGAVAPLAVFAMPKTGSTSVSAALRAVTGAIVFHVHDLDPSVLDREEAAYGPADRPWRVWDAQQLLRRPRSRDRPWRVVTLVRDPIAQSVSAFFQPAARLGYLGAATGLDDLRARFGDRLDRLPLRWFETHLQPALGIDVYAQPFHHAVGYRIITSDDVRLLVLRCEDLGSASVGLAELLGVDEPIAVPRVNVAAEKEYREVYERFVASIRPSTTQLERAYTSRLAQHFYSPDELDRFRARWTVDAG
jgi:hypothetical protein